ncbi:hypothetical protein ACW6NC_05710, partial [Salegentibacter sp. F14]
MFFSCSILHAAEFPAKNLKLNAGEQSTYFVGFLLYNPTITAPDDVNEVNDPGECHTLKSNLDLGTPTVDGTTNSATNDAPDSFPLGETIVTWTVTDDAGNTDTDIQVVTISDNEDPTASNPAPINVQCAAEVPAADPAVV